MALQEHRVVYGQTGDDRDGILTPELQEILNGLQAETADSCVAYLDSMEPGDLYPMVAMATGIGKGNIIHRVIERQIRKKADSRILVIAGTKTVLVRQTSEALEGYQGDISSFIESEDSDEVTEETTDVEGWSTGQRSLLYRVSTLKKGDGNVHVATIQSVQSEIRKGNLRPEDYDLVIVDEVHNIGTQKRKDVVSQFSKVVGFTATAYRHSGKLKKPEDYGFTVIESLTLPEAQELRLLPPLVGMQIDTKDLVSEIPTTNNGQIDFKKLEKILKESPDLRPYIADRIAKIIRTEGRTYKTVIAVNFVWEAQELAELLYAKGIKVGIAVNKQASKRVHTDEIPAIGSIDRYKLPEIDENSIQVLISPYVASEGFDAPFTEALVWASPTDSPVRYTQYTGRLARRAPRKAFGVVIDCLYQTNKYRWSYNMGMWMKDYVMQLDNGLLWLGPESDIESFGNLPQMERLRRQTDGITIDDIRQSEVLELQEEDYPLTYQGSRLFKGKDAAVMEKQRHVAETLKAEDPSLFVSRIARNHIIEACTDRQRFISEMQKLGAKLKDEVLGVQEGEFPLNRETALMFVGDKDAVLERMRELAEIMMEQDSSLFAHRQSGIHQILVYTGGRQRFIEVMLQQGFKLKEKREEVIDMLPSDMPLTEVGAMLFKGDKELVKKKLKEVAGELSLDNPALIKPRRNGNRIFDVFTDRELLMQEMLSRGYRLREDQ